jgi:hypothetical protein
MTKVKFILYTNPNNVTNRAYLISGAKEVREVLRNAREYTGSYQILYQGKGNEEEQQKAKELFSNYRF